MNFTAYNHRYRMPANESGSNTNMFYSFDYSFVHFISISSETDYPNCPFPPKFGDQIAWLEADLQAANSNRQQVPWIIVIGHRPIYSSGGGYESDGQPTSSAYYLQQAVEDLFFKYHVDVYFSGHVHSYERMFPTYQSIPSFSYQMPNATVYVVAGAGGCIEGFSSWMPGPVPDWSAYRYNSSQGFGLMRVYNSSVLEWAFIRSNDGEVLDRFTLVR